MIVSPIALFVYNRPFHTQKTVEALKKNYLADQSDLIVFSDSYKNENDFEKVDSVRKYIKDVSGFKSVTLIERSSNLGLANSIISGIDEVFKAHDRVIVLEDDLIASVYFLQFMNDALEFYNDNEDVVSVHGYVYPVKKELPETFFLKYADCWGWATWRRGWRLFDPDGASLFERLNSSGLVKKFNFNNSFDYNGMLKRQACGKENSWAIRWYATTFLANKLSLYPSESLVFNAGCDASGVHGGIETNVWNVKLCNKRIFVKPIPMQENQFVFKQFENVFNFVMGRSIKSKIRNLFVRVSKNFGFK